MLNFVATMVCLFVACKSFAQQTGHHFSFYTGYGVGKPDIRYDFLFPTFPPGTVQTVINKAGQTSLDDEYIFGIRYKYITSNLVDFGIGIGYAQLVQDFLLPADGNGYFRQTIEPYFWRDTSHYHIIQLQPTIDIAFIEKSVVLGFNGTGIANISFRKHINRFNLSRNIIEYFASELYTGVYCEYKRFRVDLGYRVLHMKHRDDAIANNGLRVDSYNPSKWRFQLSYVFWQTQNKKLD